MYVAYLVQQEDWVSILISLWQKLSDMMLKRKSQDFDLYVMFIVIYTTL
jgi:hypothetical protein